MNSLPRLSREELEIKLFGASLEGDGNVDVLKGHPLGPIRLEALDEFDSGGNKQPFDHGFRLKLNVLLNDIDGAVRTQNVVVADGRTIKMWSFIPELAKLVRNAKESQIRLVPFAGRTSSGPLKNPEGVDHGRGSAGINVDFINDVQEIARLISPSTISGESITVPMGLSVAKLEEFLEFFHNADSSNLKEKGTRLSTGFDITTADSSQLIANFITAALGDKRRGLRVSSLIIIDENGQIHYIDDPIEIEKIRGSQKPALIVAMTLELEELPAHEEAITMGIPGEIEGDEEWLNEWPEDLKVLQSIDGSEGSDFNWGDLTPEEVTYLFRIPEIYARLWPWIYSRGISEDEATIHLNGFEFLARSGVDLFAGEKREGAWTYKGDLSGMDDKARWVMHKWLEQDPLMLVANVASTLQGGVSSDEAMGLGFAEAVLLLESLGVVREDSVSTFKSKGHMPTDQGGALIADHFEALRQVRVEVPTQWRKLARKTKSVEAFPGGPVIEQRVHASQSLDNDSLIVLTEVDELRELARLEIQEQIMDLMGEEVPEEDRLVPDSKERLINLRNNIRRAGRAIMFSKVKLLRKARAEGVPTLENGHGKGIKSEDALPQDGATNIHARMVGSPDQAGFIQDLVDEADDYDRTEMHGSQFGRHVSTAYKPEGEKDYEGKWDESKAAKVRELRTKYAGGADGTFGHRSEHNPVESTQSNLRQVNVSTECHQSAPAK